jgi:hypothetical protein
MLVRPGFGETLPALLRRRHGIPERTTLLAAGALALLLVVAFLLLRDPLQGRTQRVHRPAPVFNTLYKPGLVRPVAPRGDELQRYEAGRNRLQVRFTVRPLRLPAYRGDVAGLLPVYIDRHVRELAAALPGFEVTFEGKARVHGAPGYQVAFRYGTADRPTTGRDVIVVPPEEPGARDGALLAFRQTRGRARPGARGLELVAAMRSTFRSFMYGADRDD